MSLSKEFYEAEIELILNCRKDFWFFCLYMDADFFIRRPFLKEIAEAFQKVEDGEIKKLMVSLPPRAGKSYLTSLFCAWTTGLNPEKAIMRNSYGQDLANKFSYDVREMIQSPKYLRIFNFIELRSDRASINDWSITRAKRSSYFCAGVGGAITGKGCDNVAILDDSIKNIEDALSEVILEKTWNWYLAVHKSRMEKNCPEIHISTRWSINDVLGRLDELEKNQWHKIVVPALDKNGKSFCEDVKTTEEYLKLRKLMSELIFEAEFMQNPIEAKGRLFPAHELNRFKMSDLDKYEDEKCNEFRYDSIIGYTDSADEGIDYLVSATGKIVGRKVYVTDVVFTQEKVEVTEGLVSAQIIDTKQNKHVVESNAGGKSFARKVQELIQGQSTCNVTWIPNTVNKETRILMKSGAIKEFFYFREDFEVGSPYDLFMRQFTSYVKGGKNKHDDGADCMTGLSEIALQSSVFEFA